MKDNTDGPFNDASFWEVVFDTELPYGPKHFSFDLSVGPDHTPLWGDSLFQPILNGAEAVPVLTDAGTPSLTLNISDTDGKGFVPLTEGTISFQMAPSDLAVSSFAFMTAGAEGYDIVLSNFTVTVAPEKDNRIRPQRPYVSTLGYRVGGPAVAFVEWHTDPESLAQAKVDLKLSGPDGDKIIPVRLPKRIAPISDSRVSRIDLGDLAPGRYGLTVPATGAQTAETTTAFEVVGDTTPLTEARDNAWSAFYWITEGPHGPYPDAHLQDAAAQVFGAEDQTQDVRGGWLDAGDYGKYSVNGAYSVSLMLLTGLIAPEAINHPIGQVANTPAAVPDWLRVVDGQLDWLIKMQRADGAVYHKATTQRWPAMSDTPEEDTATKWLMPVTTTATADFAAAMALAANIYDQQTDPGYKAKASAFHDAAERALAWLNAHPDLIMIAPTYDGDQYGGTYDDQSDADERFFAHAAYAALVETPEALARATSFLEQQGNALKSDEFETYWGSVGLLGMWALAATDTLGAEAEEAVTDTLRAAAYHWRVTQTRSSWNIPKEDDAQLDWGSNSVKATIAWHWLMWAAHSGEDRYVENAEIALHYLFGVNPLNRTYVTGPYRNAVRAPHFRPWSSGRIDLPPGFLSGGPNSTNLAGDPLTGAIASLPPLRMHVDDVESYATNEVAINWQSAWALYASLLTHALR